MASKVGIVGAGIAGPAFALHLLTHPILRQRFIPIIYDREPSPSVTPESKRSQTAGASIALFANGLFPLCQLGLQPLIEVASIEANVMSFARYSPSTGSHKQMSDALLRPGIRAIERKELRNILLSEVSRLGGEVKWSKTLQRISSSSSSSSLSSYSSFSPIKAFFADGEAVELEMLVGADGGWSAVRRHILQEVYRDKPEEAERRWMPDFMGMQGIYGISKHPLPLPSTTHTHATFLDRGILSTSVLPQGKTRWDLFLPLAKPPVFPAASTPSATQPNKVDSGKDTSGELQSDKEKDKVSGGFSKEGAVARSVFPTSTTDSLLRAHSDVPHATAHTLGTLIATAERIIHVPLYQRVWHASEISLPRVLVIGDAARLLLPSSGQGTNFALEESARLANALLNCSSIDDAIQSYVARSVPRADKMAKVAAFGGGMSLGETFWMRLMREVSLRWPRRRTIGEQWPWNNKEAVSLSKST